MKTRAVAVTIAVLALGFMSATLMAEGPASPGEEKGMRGGRMMEECKAMMAKHEGMKAEMSSMDAKLDSLLTAMNTAKGDKKVDATAAVINELVAQRKAMRDHMATGPQVMKHMMHHGMAEGMAKSMSNCPMHSAPPVAGEQAKHD